MTLPKSERIASGVLALHVALLFFPPIPPDIRGSLWSHLLVLVFLIASAMAVSARHQQILAAWNSLPASRRLWLGMGALAAAAIAGAAVYHFAPALFVRFSAEEGVWEPLSTVAYLCAAVLLFKAARRPDDKATRRHLLFIGALFIFLFLEEVNYLEIFGGMLPRIDGNYLGAVHDVVTLWARGAISPLVLGLLSFSAILVAVVLWQFQLLQPARIVSDIASLRGVFLVAGVLLMLVALGIEALYIPWTAGVQKPEELVELMAAICLFWFAIDLAATNYGDTAGGEPSPDIEAAT